MAIPALRMIPRREAAVLLLGMLLAGALAWLLAASGFTDRADRWLLGLLRELPPGRPAPSQVIDLPWLSALAAALAWLLRPRTARRGRPAGWLWALSPLLLAWGLQWALSCWWPPLATTLAMLLVAMLRRWRRRRFPELEPISALQSAADSALRDGDTLPCTLVRLQLRGPDGRRLPLVDLMPPLKARARRGGDRLARAGSHGFVLWLAHTDAEAAAGWARELRADLAPILARHALHCSIGLATEESAGAPLQQLWQRAAPPEGSA